MAEEAVSLQDPINAAIFSNDTLTSTMVDFWKTTIKDLEQRGVERDFSLPHKRIRKLMKCNEMSKHMVDVVVTM